MSYYHHVSAWALTGPVLLWMSLRTPLAALEPDEAKHLLVRTGFLATPAEIERLQPFSREQAVDALIASTRTVARTPPPEFCVIPLLKYQGMRNSGKMMAGKPDRELKAWWYQEMVSTDSPLTERMVLFWHNHFTSSISKVMDERLLYEQNVLFRRSGLANFALLLRDVDLDAAMFIYLDKDSNRANSPNENYAREVMELFTLGEGQQYTEVDIKEAARAFSGYQLDSRGRVVAKGDHDTRPKVVLGHEVDTGQDVILQLLLKEERVATYIAGKFWREFVSTQLDEAAVRTLAIAFYRAKYDLRVLLRATLLSEAFWHPDNRGTLVKSPTEYLVGLLRCLQLPVGDGSRVVDAGKVMGQDLFEPPNVKGWQGGNAWLNCETMLQRWKTVDILMADMMAANRAAGEANTKKPKPKSMPSKNAGGCPLVPMPWLEDVRSPNDATGVDAERLIALFLPIPPAEPVVGTDLPSVLRAVLHDPTFNLK